VSDAHPGLKAALRAVLPGIAWQRCQCHLQRDAQAYVTKHDLKNRGTGIWNTSTWLVQVNVLMSAPTSRAILSGSPSGIRWTICRRAVYAVLVGLGVARSRAFGCLFFMRL